MDDADQSRGAAARVAGVARDLRSYARRTSSAQGVDWRGDAAAQYRKMLSDNGSRLYALARDTDSLAAALRAYARTVERRQRAAGSAAGGIADAVVGAAGSIGRTVINAAEELR